MNPLILSDGHTVEIETVTAQNGAAWLYLATFATNPSPIGVGETEGKAVVDLYRRFWAR